MDDQKSENAISQSKILIIGEIPSTFPNSCLEIRIYNIITFYISCCDISYESNDDANKNPSRYQILCVTLRNKTYLIRK